MKDVLQSVKENESFWSFASGMRMSHFSPLGPGELHSFAFDNENHRRLRLCVPIQNFPESLQSF